MVVETAWLISRAMLMPLERMRVGINSDSASHTQTPGPTAKKAMKTKMQSGRQPAVAAGWAPGVISAFSIFSGAPARAASRLANGLEKKASTLLSGDATVARDLDGLGRPVVGAHDVGGGAEIAVGVDDDQRWPAGRG